MTANTYFSLDCFLAAQAPVIDQVFEELLSGRKEGHWMWFIFPQLAGLGRSAMADLFALASVDQACRYFSPPVLGPRLWACTHKVLECKAQSLEEIFGSPDDLKFRSCMTLFAQAVGKDEPIFRRALDKWCGGIMDERTLLLLEETH